MGGLVLKKLSTIHFPLSIARCGRKKLYLFNCISLRIQVAGVQVLLLQYAGCAGATVAVAVAVCRFRVTGAFWCFISECVE